MMINKCVICGEPATHECANSLGAAWHCWAPLCEKHTQWDHHPDDKAWREFIEVYKRGRDIDAKTFDHMWYAFGAGWTAHRLYVGKSEVQK